ncbi:Peptidase M48-like protein [Rubrivivax sp. A210]|uniref:M48 family metallopeptidase n=1 Tax=Rubrivivax sp. A210 TaxID=2772301 RepID=UPI00191989C4|nr:M48 family metallopeptidase [Rubrivivax sp. A210]CAD5373298.1 Peptidase M48-like protein [Rubrivivax sp. A210]
MNAETESHTACFLCALHGRRQFTRLLATGGALALAGPALAQQQPAAEEGVRRDVGRASSFTKLVSAEQVESAATQQYTQMAQQAASKGQLAPADHPQVQRLRTIARRIIPHAAPWNPRATEWKWSVNLLIDPQLNAFCMPGGKIAFYSGILQKLQLSDEEVATIMGHEVAHALREHARERMGKTMATRGAIEIGAALFGFGGAARMAADMGGQLLTLKFGRDDESEADIVGMDLAARAGYDPGAGVTLWQKMLAANKGAPPQWMSTHPSGDTRIRDIQGKLPKVLPLYQRAEKPTQRFGPPPAA